MKKFLRIALEFTAVMGLITIFTNLGAISAFAASWLPITKDIYESGNIPTPPSKTGQDIMKDLILGGLTYVKVIVAVIGIVFISIMGFQLIIAMGTEEDITKARRGLTYAVIAFLMVSMSEDVARIFDMEKKTLLESPQEILKRVHLFDKQVEIFMTFIKYIIGAYATLMLVYSGSKLITAGGSEEDVSKHKKGVMYSAGGLVLIYIGEIFIEKVFYKVDKQVYSGITGVHPGVNAKEGAEQLAGITNFIISFAGPVAILMLVAGAIMYATAGGEEEKMTKAKRLIFATIIGIVIIYGSFAIVSTVISSKLTEIGVLAE